MSKRLRADLALAPCSLLWGATFVVVKNALDHASVFIFLAVRFTLTAVLMLAFSYRLLRRFEREDLFAGVRLGCFMFFGIRVSDRGLTVHDAFKIRLRHRLGRRLEKTKTEN